MMKKRINYNFIQDKDYVRDVLQEVLKLELDRLYTQINGSNPRDLSDSYILVGRIFVALGGHENLNQSLVFFQESLGVYQTISQEEGTSESYRDLFVNYNYIANVYTALGGYEDLDHALEFYQKGLEIWDLKAREEGTPAHQTAKRRQ